MNIEHKVTSLEWSKKLKACGFPQGQSEFVWRLVSRGSETQWEVDYRRGGDFDYNSIDALLPCEIVEELPYDVEYQKHVDGDSWMLIHPSVTDPLGIQDKTLANALAAMYCYLQEKGFLKSADIALSDRK